MKATKRAFILFSTQRAALSETFLLLAFLNACHAVVCVSGVFVFSFLMHSQRSIMFLAFCFTAAAAATSEAKKEYHT
jgi:hypothetical protein